MYIPLIDLMKFVFSIFIFLHHAEINLLIKKGIPSSYFGTSYLAVEGFLLISGFFIASNVTKAIQKNDFDYRKYFYHRASRIMPPMIIALLIYLLYQIISYVLFGLKIYSFFDFITSVLLLGDVFVGNQIVGFWYLPVYFWGGALLAYLLFKYNKSSIIIFPFFTICGYAWIFHQFGGLSLHAEPYIGGAMVGGTLRGISGLSLGISLYIFNSYLKAMMNNIRHLWLLTVLAIALIMVFKLFLRSGPTNRDFQIIFYLSIILIYIYNHDIQSLMQHQIIFKLFGKLSYYIFLIHILVFNILTSFGGFNKISGITRILLALFVTMIFSSLLVKYDQIIILRLKRVFLRNADY